MRRIKFAVLFFGDYVIGAAETALNATDAGRALAQELVALRAEVTELRRQVEMDTVRSRKSS
jgi:hypothetical protein